MPGENVYTLGNPDAANKAVDGFQGKVNLNDPAALEAALADQNTGLTGAITHEAELNAASAGVKGAIAAAGLDGDADEDDQVA